MGSIEVIGRNLRRFRDEMGHSQETVALDVDMSLTTYRALEKGSGNPTLKTLERLASYFQVSVIDLMDERPRDGKRDVLRDNDYLFEYDVLERRSESPDRGSYVSYGLQLRMHTKLGQFVEAYPDLTSDRVFVEEQAAMFNALQLSPIHFRDVVMDMIGGQSDYMSARRPEQYT